MQATLRYFIAVLLGLLNCILATGQTYSSITSDKDIYGFLNWMTVHERKHSEEPRLKRKCIDSKILSWDTANFIPNDTTLLNTGLRVRLGEQYLYQSRAGTDAIFDQQDREFILKQFMAIKDSVWHDRFSKSRQLIKKKQRRANRYNYSVPLFSADKNYVIVQRRYYCGSLCAYFGYYVYKRIENNEWEYVTSVNTFMS